MVAYYLVALLREEHAAGQQDIVTSVAVQQAPGNPMDDVIVEFREDGARRLLSLQVKRRLRISAAASNTDFRDIMTSAVATRRTVDFQVEVDAYRFAVEHVAVKRLRSLNRLSSGLRAAPMTSASRAGSRKAVPPLRASGRFAESSHRSSTPNRSTTSDTSMLSLSRSHSMGWSIAALCERTSLIVCKS